MSDNMKSSCLLLCVVLVQFYGQECKKGKGSFCNIPKAIICYNVLDTKADF